MSMTAPSEKATRYDRQLRLWGDHGQAALESAHVCLINASATGTEIVKNLVLPGIGAFTILDSKRVTPADVGANFFLPLESIGRSRAQSAVRLLTELNGGVKGSFIDEEIESILATDPNFFSQFSIVIATEMQESSLLTLAEVLWKASVPLLVARSYGLVGYLRFALPDHEVVESHPDNYHEDLRLDSPFPGLVKFVSSINLDALDDNKHANVPYLVLLYKFLQKWKSSHDAAIPKNYREKSDFKEMIRISIRRNEDGVPLDEENFDEAIQNVNSVIIPTRIPSVVQAIFDDPKCVYISPESSNFWLLARALREFVTTENDQKLPLRGSIPDMISSSDMYIQLSQVYQEQAREDIALVTSHLSSLLQSIGKPTNFIPEVEIKQFCRNSAFLRVLRYRSIAEEYETPNPTNFVMHLENQDSEMAYYVLLRAADQFFSLYKFFPGSKDGALESDIVQVKSIVTSLLQRWGIAVQLIRDEQIAEFCRYGAAEIHSVAAFVGGVAAQEVIKVITCQFVPFNNTLIYSAVSSTTLTVEI